MNDPLPWTYFSFFIAYSYSFVHSVGSNLCRMVIYKVECTEDRTSVEFLGKKFTYCIILKKKKSIVWIGGRIHGMNELVPKTFMPIQTSDLYWPLLGSKFLYNLHRTLHILNFENAPKKYSNGSLKLGSNAHKNLGRIMPRFWTWLKSIESMVFDHNSFLCLKGGMHRTQIPHWIYLQAWWKPVYPLIGAFNHSFYSYKYT